MNATTTKKNTYISNWKKTEDIHTVFTADDLINAYFKGKKDGKDSIQNIVNEKINSNILLASDATNKLINSANESVIKFEEIFLKINDVTNFTSLVIVKTEDLVSNKFLAIIKKARKITLDFEKNDLHISFEFMPSSSRINHKRIAADGFVFKYDKK